MKENKEETKLQSEQKTAEEWKDTMTNAEIKKEIQRIIDDTIYVKGLPKEYREGLQCLKVRMVSLCLKLNKQKP